MGFGVSKTDQAKAMRETYVDYETYGQWPSRVDKAEKGTRSTTGDSKTSKK